MSRRPTPGGNDVTGPTLADVAAAAEVSRQTVSNVVNAPHRVKPETRERVEQAIDRLGYRPNRLARSLRTQSSHLIGYRIDPDDVDALAQVVDRFLHALAGAARAAGYQLLLFTSDEQGDEITTYTELYGSAAVDGFVLSGTDRLDASAMHTLLERRVPVVTFGRTDVDDRHPWVDVDNSEGTAEVVADLHARGHRRIAFLGWPTSSRVGNARHEGWRTACERLGLAPAGWDRRGADTVADGARMAAELLSGPERPTAVVCCSDSLAVGCLGAAKRHGLTVGKDLAIVGYDDTPTARVLDPPLSSVRQPIEEVGRTIVELFAAARTGGPGDNGTPYEGVLLSPRLVVRASSEGPAPN
jgi:DNA-binding LacI/PurR family transcriptional regulator